MWYARMGNLLFLLWKSYDAELSTYNPVYVTADSFRQEYMLKKKLGPVDQCACRKNSSESCSCWVIGTKFPVLQPSSVLSPGRLKKKKGLSNCLPEVKFPWLQSVGLVKEDIPSFCHVGGKVVQWFKEHYTAWSFFTSICWSRTSFSTSQNPKGTTPIRPLYSFLFPQKELSSSLGGSWFICLLNPYSY